MHDRVPAALAWLVKRRRAIGGQLQQAISDLAGSEAEAESARGEIAVHAAKLKSAERWQRMKEVEIKTLKDDLAALDRALLLHKIPIDPDKLGSTKIQKHPRRHRWGALSASIYRALASVAPQAMTTDQLVSFVVVDCDFGVAPETYERLRHKIRKQVQAMAAQGRLMRVHAPYSGPGEMGLWCLLPQPGLRALAQAPGARDNAQ